MSKSLGNVVEPQELIQKYGADIVRLWVASLDYRDDDPISEEILARCAEAYRKIRNTARYLISNLYDFDPGDRRPPRRAAPASRPLGSRRRPGPRSRRIVAAYESYEFHVIYHQLVNFLRHDALGVLLRHPQGPALRLRRGLARAPVGPDGPVAGSRARSRRSRRPSFRSRPRRSGRRFRERRKNRST